MMRSFDYHNAPRICSTISAPVGNELNPIIFVRQKIAHELTSVREVVNRIVSLDETVALRLIEELNEFLAS